MQDIYFTWLPKNLKLLRTCIFPTKKLFGHIGKYW